MAGTSPAMTRRAGQHCAYAFDRRRYHSSARRPRLHGQGSGYFPYPAESFMISQTRWVYYGAAMAIGGLVLIMAARR
jgi:hypothetical protein